MIDRRPALIARCASREDVAEAVNLARIEGLPMSVRGGGHGVAGTAVCGDGLMVDLSPLKDVRVDAGAREIVAGAGVLWREFDEAAGKFALATTGGQVSHTGIAGLTLGGGLGYLIGKHGAACDNLLSVEMVTAEGEILTASEEMNSDLFWAMRGAGANFGVVTEFRYQLHPLPVVLGGMLLYPREMATELIPFYREYLKETPDELITEFLFLNAPDGTPVTAIIAVFCGDPAEGQEVLKPLREFGPPIADLIQPMPYAAVQKILDDAAPTGDRYYWKANFVDTLTDDLGEVMRQGANAMPSPFSVALLFEIKGAIKRIPKENMAFDHRDATFEMSVISRWMDPTADAANKAWTRDVWAAAQPYVSKAVYNNHLSEDEGADRVRASYGEEKFARLAVLKAKYDPTNLFCHNHNIPPLA
jgi:FAD/FMN-containing dehydrogenase